MLRPRKATPPALPLTSRETVCSNCPAIKKVAVSRCVSVGPGSASKPKMETGRLSKKVTVVTGLKLSSSSDHSTLGLDDSVLGGDPQLAQLSPTVLARICDEKPIERTPAEME